MALNQAQSVGVFVWPKNESNATQASADFKYNFVFSSSTACSSLLNVSVNITTDEYGRGFALLNTSTLTTTPSYLCEYRNDSLRATHELNLNQFENHTARINDVNTTANIMALGFNVTADYDSRYYQQTSGSLDNTSWNQSHADTLYAPIGGGGDNASWNESFANTLYVHDDDWTTIDDYPTACSGNTVVQGLGDTLTCVNINTLTAGDANTLGGQNTIYYLNSTGGTYDNQSWNESYAGTLYAPISVTGDNTSWNQSYADTLYADISTVSDNTSWNQSGADARYYQQASGSLDNTSWNQSHADTLYSTGAHTVDTNRSDSDIANVLQNDTIPREGTAQCSGTDQAYNVTINESGVFLLCSAQGSGGGMTSWVVSNGSATFTVTDSVRVNITAGRNVTINQTGGNLTIHSIDTDTVLSEATVDSYADNNNYLDLDTQTTDNLPQGSTNLYDNKSWNQSGADSRYYQQTSGSLDNASWNQSHADTLYLGISAVAADTILFGGQNTIYYLNSTGGTYDNQSWNESYADTLYAPISVTGDNASWNQSYADTLYADISVTGDNTSWNQSHADTLYSTGAHTTDTNRSDEEITDLAGGMATGNTETLITVTFQDADNTIDYEVTSTLSSYTDDLGHTQDNTSWNQSHADTLYAPISVTGDNASWNQSYADTLYADISVTGDNTSWNQSHADTLYSTGAHTTDTNASTGCGTNTFLGGSTDGCVDISGWDQDSSNDLTTSSLFNNASTSRINVSGAYNTLNLVITANSITGTDIDETTVDHDTLSGAGTVDTEAEVEGVIFDNDNTGNLNTTGSLNASAIYVSGIDVCLSDGTNCPATAAATTLPASNISNGTFGSLVGGGSYVFPANVTSNNVTIDNNGKLRVSQTNDAANPTISFGDGDTGFYEASDDVLRIAIGGTARWIIQTNSMKPNTVWAAAIYQVPTSRTTPAYSFVDDNDTGIGRVQAADSGEFSLIANSSEIVRIIENQVDVYRPLNASNGTYLNVTGCSGDLETDANGLIYCGTDQTGGGGSTTLPATNISAGTFGSLVGGGIYAFPTNMSVYNLTINTSGTIYLPTGGSSSVPTIGFGTSGDTGIYESGSNTLSITTGGTQRFSFSSQGINSIQANGPRVRNVAGDNVTPSFGTVDSNAVGLGFGESGGVSDGTGYLIAGNLPTLKFAPTRVDAVVPTYMTNGTYINATNCDSVDTDSNGMLKCGTDATGGAGSAITTINSPNTSLVVQQNTTLANLSINQSYLDQYYLRNSGFLAGNITSGNIDIARLPIGGTWSLSSKLTIQGQDVNLTNANLNVTGNITVAINSSVCFGNCTHSRMYANSTHWVIE